MINSVATVSPSWVLFRIFLFFGFLAAPLSAAQRADQPLSTAISVKQLSGGELDAGIPARIEGVVTYYDPDAYQFFVQDSTAGVYVRGGFDRGFRVGDLLRVEGIVKRGRLSNLIDEPVFTVLGRAKLPEPKELTEAQIKTPTNDCDRVKIKGVLRAISEEGGRLVYQVGVGRQRVKVTIFTLARDKGGSNIGRILSITGVHTSLYDGRREMAGMGLLVHSLQAITGEPGGTAYYDLPVVSVKDLEKLETGTVAHVQVLTEEYAPGRMVNGHDESGRLTAQTSQEVPMKRGTVADLVGYVARTNGIVFMEDAYFQRIGFGNRRSFGQYEEFKPLRLIESVAEVRRLSQQDSARGYPVRIRGVITYYDPAWALCFVQGSTEGIFVSSDDQSLDIAPGLLVVLSGYTAKGGFAPQIERPKFDLFGKTPMPSSKRVAYSRLLSGAEDSQWLQIEGVIRSISDADVVVNIEFVPSDSNETVCHVFLPKTPGQAIPSDLEDSRVEIEAVCGTEFDPAGRMKGVNFHCPGFSYIRAVGTAERDPFSRPIIPIGTVFQFTPSLDSSHRVHVRGAVTWSDGRSCFYMQDATGGLRVESQGTNVVVGRQIDATGFRNVRDSTPSLAQGLIRTAGETADISAKALAIGEAFAQANIFDGQLLRLEGRLLESRRVPEGVELLLENGKTLFSALLGKPNPDHPALPEPGSLLQLDGVAVFAKDSTFQARGLKLLLRAGSDIVVLQGPPSWSSRRLAMALGLSGAAVLLALLWIAILRNRIAKHKAILDANLETQRALETHVMQAQKMDSIGNLAGGVAHDFNNLLMVILGYASILKQENLSGDGKEAVEEIEGASGRAVDLTRQLLVFSRKQAPETKVLDINDTIQNLTKMLARLLGEDIHLRFQPGHGPILVDADKGMLEQILMNLAINSRDAMPSGGTLLVTTEIRKLKPSEAPESTGDYSGSFVCLSVSDTGAGISPEILPRIFDPFFTTKEVGKGTGLGLATVYGIVKQHHGWIDVESKPGEGARFTIFFPISKQAPASETASEISHPDTSGQGVILLVEDEVSVRRLSRQSLERAGYRVLEADSGPAALAVAEQNPSIELVISDVIMPGGMTGAELAQTLMARYPGTPIILTSGYSEFRGQPIELPKSAAFLQKPYPPEVLLKAVRAALAKAPVAVETHES